MDRFLGVFVASIVAELRKRRLATLLLQHVNHSLGM